MIKITSRVVCDKCSYFSEVSFYPSQDSIKESIDNYVLTQGWGLVPDKEHTHPQLHCPKCVKEATEIDTFTKAKKVTLSGNAPCEDYDGPAPCPIDPKTGMHEDYWILAPEERAKGFVRPVRRTYLHKGMRPLHPTRELTAEEHERFDQYGYVRYEEYPNISPGDPCGRFWTEKQLKSGCGGTTTMATALAETYARDPKFYGSTFCCNCGKHLSVEEFVWDGTTEKVGS